jgi:cytochrome c biogenesis protein CcdA
MMIFVGRYWLGCCFGALSGILKYLIWKLQSEVELHQGAKGPWQRTKSACVFGFYLCFMILTLTSSGLWSAFPPQWSAVLVFSVLSLSTTGRFWMLVCSGCDSWFRLLSLVDSRCWSTSIGPGFRNQFKPTFRLDFVLLFISTYVHLVVAKYCMCTVHVIVDAYFLCE